MTEMQWGLEGLVVVLLIATLIHAIRLERALGLLRRDRTMLEELIVGFNDSTRQAENGIERLRAASEGAGRQIARHIDQAKLLKDDLVFLADRAEQTADRMEGLLRQGKAGESKVRPQISSTIAPPAIAAVKPGEDRERVRSDAELDLLRALRLAN